MNTFKDPKSYFVHKLRNVISGKPINREEANQCLIYLLDHTFGEANDVCFGSFLAALQTKRPTVDEVSGLMDAVLHYDRREIEIDRNFSEPLCGIIGSGKDDVKTFNVSSISSIVASAAGAKVLKNGSRAEASVAGTTDVFEELGANVLLREKSVIEESLSRYNFAFCDAEPYFPKMVKEYLGKYFFVHPLSYILPVASGVDFDRVVFGLATNATEFTAELLMALGYDNSLVVSGRDKDGHKFDEISNIGPTKITEIKNGKTKTYTINPEDLGIKTAEEKDISEGNSVADNAKIFMDIITGVEKGSKRDIILMNAGAVLYVSGQVNSIKNGINLAAKTIDQGKAKQVLDGFVSIYK